MYSFESLLNLEADGEGVPNAYSLTLLLTGNEAGERFHHALGFSVAMRFEGSDDLYLADSTVLENDKTSWTIPCTLSLIACAGYLRCCAT